MAIKIILPFAQGDQSNWTLGAGGSKAAAVSPGDPVSHDDDTTYITDATANLDSFQVTGVPAMSAVADYKIGIRARTESGTSNIVAGVRFTTTNGGNNGGVVGTSYTTTAPASVARPGGGSYVPSDFVNGSNACQIFVQGAGGVQQRITSAWGELDFTPANGGFAFLVALGPIASLLGAGLTFAEFCRALTYLPDVHYTADETLDLWRELRAYRHPTFFLPAVA